MTRLVRALVGCGALVIVVLLASGCASSQAPAPTPDPFAGLADRSDQAYRHGLEAYGQGQFREALTAFEQAKTLSPNADSRIDQMIDRTKSAMAPTPTPVPPTPTEVPATPTPTTVPMSQQVADTDLGKRYFGKLGLAVVPGKDSDAPAVTQFFFQDQIGLQIEGLKQHLRLPFTLRVFNADTTKLVASVSSDDAAATSTGASVTTASAPESSQSVAPSFNIGAAFAPTPAATAATGASGMPDFRVVKFWDTYVWYHQGGEEPGRYRLELYANGVLTNTFDYSVGTVPMPTPEATAKPVDVPTAAPTVAPVVDDLPPPPPAPVVAPPAPPAPAPAPARVAPEPQPTVPPTPLPSPTPIPTPSTAYTTQVGGLAAGLDVDSYAGRFYLADSTGVIWTTDANSGQQRPSLGQPINIGPRAPVDLTIDQSTGYLYLSARSCTPAAPGCVVAVDGRNGGTVLRSISLPGAPTEVRVDSELGLLYVAVPDKQALVQVDIRSGNIMNTISGLPQITDLALDSARHTLYAAHLGGQVSVVDVRSAQVIGRASITGAGLTSIATSRGLVYGVNTATHELAVLEPMSQAVADYPLSQEPAAVAAAEDSGAVYVLSSRSDVILQIDPTSGAEIGRVNMTSRSGHVGLGSASNLQSLQPRIVLDPATDSVFASLPESGELAAIGNDQFPVMANAIPFVEAPDRSLVASIPGVIWPGGAAGPSQPAPTLNADKSDNADPEGI